MLVTVSASIYMYIHIDICIHTYMHTYIHIYMHIYMYVYSTRSVRALISPDSCTQVEILQLDVEGVEAWTADIAMPQPQRSPDGMT